MFTDTIQFWKTTSNIIRSCKTWANCLLYSYNACIVTIPKFNLVLVCAYCSSHACLKTCYSHPTTCHRYFVTYAIASFLALKLMSVRVKPEYNYMGHNDYCFLIIPSSLFHNARLVSTHIQFLYITNLSQCHIFSLFQVVTLGRGWLLKGNPDLIRNKGPSNF